MRDNLKASNGQQIAAGTARHNGEVVAILVDSTFGGPRSVAHEFCHVLGSPGELPDGICSPHGGDLIDAAALDKVCADWPCVAMAPEG